MYNEITNKIYSELVSEEELVWCGQPNPKKILYKNIFLTFFGLFFTLFSLFWTIMASLGVFVAIKKSFTATNFIFLIFPIFGLPFIAVGFWVLTIPYREYLKSKNTVYAVTNKRIIIAFLGDKKEINSYLYSEISDIHKTEFNDGSANIIFRRNLVQNQKRSFIEEIGFYGIKDYNRAYNYILNNIEKYKTI